jgi:hypothetical protein
MAQLDTDPRFFSFIATSSKDDLHRRIGGHCSTGNTKVIFKVFGEGDAIKTTTEPTPPISNDSGKTPPRIDTWPNNAWKNHHNDDAGSSSDSTNSESDLTFRQNESPNKNFNINNSFGYPSTQRPIYVNRDNHNNINSNINNNMSGGNNVNKPTKKTSEYCILDMKKCSLTRHLSISLLSLTSFRRIR